jgi:hypothetical protein
MGDSFTWTNTGSGNWSAAASWFDVTTGTPAAVAPGPTDTAEIDNPGTGNITVTGPADVTGLSVSGQVTLAGSYVVGSFVLGVPPFNPSSFGPTLTSTVALAGNFSATSLSIGDLHLVPGFPSSKVADYGIIEVGQGAILSAGTVTLNAGDLQVAGGAASIANDLTLGIDLFPEPSLNAVDVTSGSLDVTNHGSVQLGGLAITDGSVNLDATSTLEIGDAGTAAAGTITIDPGATLGEGDASAYFTLAVRNAETVTTSSPLLNNGTINSAFDVSNVINNGVIFANNATVRSISGDGLLDLRNAGTIGSSVSGTLDFSASQSTVFDLGSDVPIDAADTPLIVNFSTIAGSPGPTSDTIVLDGISADTATYTTTGPGIGTLALYDDGTTPVASLTMLGTYANDAFEVTPGSGDSVVSLNTVAVGNSYTWIAPGSGDWATPSNWFDVSTGTPTAVAPGPADTAEIDNTGTSAMTVTGPGDAGTASVSGDVTLAGSYAIGTLNLGIPPGTKPDGPITGTFISTIALEGTFDVSSLTIGYAISSAAIFPPSVVDIGVVNVDAGSVLSVGGIDLASGDLLVDGGSVDDSGVLYFGSTLTNGPVTEVLAEGTLDITHHGSVSIAESLNAGPGAVELDATSTLEIGSAGTATAGTITVDPDATIVLNGVKIAAPILNNGTVQAYSDLSNTINNGTIILGSPRTSVTLSDISGSGQIDIDGDSGLDYLRPLVIGPNISGTLNLPTFPGNTVTIDLGPGVPINTTDTPGIAFGPYSQYYENQLVLQGISADTATYTAAGPGIGTLALYDDGTTPIASLTILGTDTSDAFLVSPGSGDSVVTRNPNLACFAAGTRIAAPRGEVPVEALSSGDEVTLVSGGTAPIVWIGRRRVDCQSHPTPHDVWPVRIRRGAFAPNEPHRDLFLSPDHAVSAENVLIPIKHLTNGDTVRQVERETVEYFHIELPAHDILLADGLPVESYLDTGDRGSFENGGRVVALFPVFSPFAWDALGCAPLVVTGPPVAAVRQRIERQARRLNGTRQRRRNMA